MDALTKSPAEKFPIRFNFSTDFIPGETIYTKTLTCWNANTGVDSKAAIVDSEAISDADIVTVIKAGTEGDEHRIQCVITTSKGGRYQRDILLVIQSVIDDTFNKQPDDQIMFDLTFAHRLETGDELASATAIAIQEADGTDDSGTVIYSVDWISPKAAVRTMGGVDGETYRIAVQGTTDFGYIYEKFIRMNVQELP